MISHLLTQVATRLRYPVIVDEYNNEVRDTANPVIATYGCRLEQTPSTEITLGSNTQVSNWVVYLPPEADVKGTDVIQVNSVSYEVLGPAVIQETPRGPHHKMANLTYIE